MGVAKRGVGENIFMPASPRSVVASELALGWVTLYRRSGLVNLLRSLELIRHQPSAHKGHAHLYQSRDHEDAKLLSLNDRNQYRS